MPWRLVLVSNVAANPPAVTPKNFLRSIGAPGRAKVAEFCNTDYGIGKTCRWQAQNGRKSFRESIFLVLGMIAAVAHGRRIWTAAGARNRITVAADAWCREALCHPCRVCGNQPGFGRGWHPARLR